MNKVKKDENSISGRVRVAGFDLISGVMIIWMVMYHIFQWSGMCSNVIYKQGLYWLFFFIPWFYFKSGYFYNPNANDSALRSIGDGVSKIIAPMIIWAAIGGIVWIPERIFIFHLNPLKVALLPLYSILKTGDVLSNLPLWFFVSLFFTKIISAMVLKRKFPIVYVAGFLLVGWMISNHMNAAPLNMATFPIGVAFYCFGYMYSVYAEKIPNTRLVAIASLVAFVYLNLHFGSYVDVHRNSLQYGNYGAFCGLSLFATLLIVRTLKNMHVRLISWCGKQSIYIFALHWPVLSIIKDVCDFFCIKTQGGIYFAILSAVAIPSVMLLAKVLSESRGFYLLNEKVRSFLMRCVRV